MAYDVRIQPIFIAGAQRSGTTLLRLLLNAHSEIAVPGEAAFLMPLLNQANVRRRIRGTELERLSRYLELNQEYTRWNCDRSVLLKWLRTRDSIGLKELLRELYGSYCREQGKRRWGDKTPSFFRKLEVLVDLFPNARVIHIVRDGRDAMLSLRERDPSKRYPAVDALEWAYKIRVIERAFKRLGPNQHMTVLYEDLVSMPESTLTRICGFLGIGFEENMLRYHGNSARFIGRHHSSLIFHPITSNRVGRWRRELPARERGVFELVAGSTLHKYGYERHRNGFETPILALTGLELLVGLPQRILQVTARKSDHRRALADGRSVSPARPGQGWV